MTIVSNRTVVGGQHKERMYHRKLRRMNGIDISSSV